MPVEEPEQADKQSADNGAQTTAETEQVAARDSNGSSNEVSEEKHSASSQVDVERGTGELPNLGRRRTFGQRLRNRLRTRSGFSSEAPPLKLQNLDELPRGYPQLAGFVNIDTNTHLYRRFGYLRNRVLLYAQDELVCLERKLAALDEDDDQKEPYRLASRSWDEEDDPRRKILMDQIKAKLKEYDDLLMREERTLSMEVPSQKLHNHYRNYLWHEKPLAPEDSEFVYRKDDMVNLHGYHESNWIKPVIDSVMMTLPPSVMRVLFKKRSDDSSATHQYQVLDTRLEFVVKLIVLLLSMLLLLVPVVLLYVLDQISPGAKLGIIFAFTAIFTGATLYLTRAKQHEVFVALATYCAVLVVFLGNLPNQN